MPFDVFALAVTDENLGAVQRVALCRLPKLLRVLDLPSLARACANAAEAFLKCRLSNNARSLAALAGGYALTAHLCAVGFFGLDQVGVELEDPFGVDHNDFPILSMAHALCNDLDAMVRTVSRTRMEARLTSFASTESHQIQGAAALALGWAEAAESS